MTRPLLTLFDIERIIKDVTYLPGATIRLIPSWSHNYFVGPIGEDRELDNFGLGESAELRIETLRTDVDRPNCITRVTSVNLVRGHMFKTPDDFLNWLGSILEKAEVHESREWFKYQGRKFRDPHGEACHSPKKKEA